MASMKNSNRYVAHFDMLGMTSAIRKNADEAWGALSDLRKSEKDIVNKYRIRLPNSNTFVDGRVHSKRFSDTIVFYTLGNQIEDLYAILFKSALLFCESLKNCVPLRGGIAFGEFFINDELDMFLGKALVDAHDLGETAQWLGVVIGDAIYQKRDLIPDHNNQHFIIKWDLSIKGEKEIKKESNSVLNWPTSFKPTVNIPVSLKDFYAPFERLFGPFEELPTNIQGKYKNTVDFMNYQLTGNTI